MEKAARNRPISVAEMRKWEDATWAAGIEEEPVMRLAGKAVARKAEQMTKSGDTVLVLAGKGKNGGDAIYAAEYIENRIVDLVKITSDPGEAVPKVQGFQGSLIIDGLFGIGLNRPLTGGWADLVMALNSRKVPVLAVDTPSGLDGDTGEALGGVAVKAAATVTFGAAKVGLLKQEAKEYVGDLVVA